MLLVVTLLLAAGLSGATPAARTLCQKTYTRQHFHVAAKSTYSTAFPLQRKVRTLDRIQRCQRRPESKRIVRMHRRQYRKAWAARFYFEHRWAATPSWVKDKLRSIRLCESGDNPRAVSSSGAYRGLYQFSFSTWGVVGGSGDPAAAPRVEQNVRAADLLMNHGAGHWPICGQ